MAELRLPKPKIGRTDKETIQNLMNAYDMLRKDLESFIQNIDSDNVTEINTNITRVRSNQGTTEIKGPLITMKDSQVIPTARLQLGYDKEQGKFVFELYDTSGNKTAYLDENGTEVLNGQLLITYLGKVLLHAFKDTEGGKISVYDNAENLNAKIGVEGTDGQNVGGTIVLYNDSSTKPRAALGTYGMYDSGFIILYGPGNVGRVYATASQNGEGSIFIYDSAGNLKSRLTETIGTVNGETIATQNWVASSLASYISAYLSGYATTGDVDTAKSQAMAYASALMTEHLEQYHSTP